MKNEKAREIRIWIREQGPALYFFLAILIFLFVKTLFDLSENLQNPRDYIDADSLPNKIAFCLLVLWISQMAVFHKRITNLTSSTLFLILFGFILAAYFLAAYAWLWVAMFQDFFSNRHSLHIPSLHEYLIFLQWAGDELWRLEFPWGGVVFPLFILLFYTVFIACFLFYLRLENRVSLIIFSSLSIGLNLLLLSALLESLKIMSIGVGYSSISGDSSLSKFLIEHFHIEPFGIGH